MVITLDGPVASGKSTLARLLAQKLGFYYINSGLLFRAIAYLVSKEYGSDKESLEVVQPKDILAVISRHSIRYTYTDNASVFIDGDDVTAFLKTAVVDRVASIISVYPDIREKVLQMQRDLARSHSSVVEGRDAGTVVFPHAELHIYLTASVEVRAFRWQKDMERKGYCFTHADAIAQIVERDARDSSRACAPLSIPLQAHIVDATDKTIEAVLADIIKLVDGVCCS